LDKTAIRPGDILVETRLIEDSADEVARYLVIGRHREWNDNLITTPTSIMYYETVLLRVSYSQFPSWIVDPGDVYCLSEHEISNFTHASWKREFESSLSWSDEYDSDNQT